MKYEEVYLKDYQDGGEAEASLEAYFQFYSHERNHQALGYRTPATVYRASGSSRQVGDRKNDTKSRATNEENLL